MSTEKVAKDFTDALKAGDFVKAESFCDQFALRFVMEVTPKETG